MHKFLFIFLITAVLSFVAFIADKNYVGLKGNFCFLNCEIKKPESRLMMERVEDVVRSKKPTPTQSSRLYAIVATEYYKRTFENKNTKDGVVGLNDQAFVVEDFATTTIENILQEVVLQEEFENKKVTLKTDPENWVGQKPFSPGAPAMSRFNLDEAFIYQVPQPPFYKSAEFYKALDEVKNASDRRTVEQGALINFWGGVPGTEAPAGIWQNRLYDVTRNDGLSDKEYAYAQMVLAQAVADSFMECWKVKYVYQTKRPDMTDPSISVAMPNPPFPSYVSGHSTISYTAATVLGELFPEYKDIFMTDAETAKNSRLWAGIHFPYDNDEGQKLGVAVGEFVAQKLNLKKI